MLKKIISLYTKSQNFYNICTYIQTNLETIIANKDPNVTLNTFPVGYLQQTSLITLHNFNNQQFVLKKLTNLNKFSIQELKDALAELKKHELLVPQIIGDEIKHHDDKYLIWEYVKPTRVSNLTDLEQMILKFWLTTSKTPIKGNPSKFNMLDKLKEYGNLFAKPDINKYFPDTEFTTTCQKWIDYFLSPEFAKKYEQLPKYYAHRDLTPGNIIVAKEGNFLIDWDYICVDTRLADIVRPFGYFATEERIDPITKKKTYHSDPNNLLKKVSYLQNEIAKSPYKMNDLEKELFPQIALLNFILNTCEDLVYYQKSKITLAYLQSKILTIWGAVKEFVKVNSLKVPAKPTLIAIFEKGQRFQVGPHTILNLHGSYREMGRQYGALVKKELEQLISYIKPERYMIINTADAKEAISNEFTFNEAKDVKNFIVATNHFVHPEWNPKKIYKPLEDSSDRRQNVIKKFSNPDKKTSLAELKNMLETPIKHRGVSFPEPHSIYRLIAIPEDLKIWVKAPEFYDWTEIDLKPFFES